VTEVVEQVLHEVLAARAVMKFTLHKDTCPGWYLDRQGNIEDCWDCGIDIEEAERRADAFFDKHVTHPRPEEERCDPSCRGFGIFTSSGRSRGDGPHVERCDECSVYPYDDEAIEHAIAVCVKNGVHITDGHGEGPDDVDAPPFVAP